MWIFFYGHHVVYFPQPKFWSVIMLLSASEFTDDGGNKAW